jgi:hypothetical protein
VADGQLQRLLPPQLCADRVPTDAQDPQEESHFFIDGFRRRLLFQPDGLIVLHGLVGHVNRHEFPQMLRDV